MISPRWLEQSLRDVLYGVRVLSKSRVSTAMIILTLALGIGATSAIFSVVEAVLLRPLPYRDPSKLVVIFDAPVHDRESKIFVPYRHLDPWREKTQSFAGLAAESWIRGPHFLVGPDGAQSVLGAMASVDLFDVLGVTPQLGRTFTRDDLSRGCVIVLSHKFWESRLASRPDIVGQNLTLDDGSCTVAGVMPASFVFFPAPVDLWSLATPASELDRNADRNGVAIFGRLKPGVSIAAAQGELSARARQIDDGRAFEMEVEPVIFDLQQEFTWLAGRNLRLSLVVLFAAVGFILAIACVNVANLLLARASVRQRELAIRAALGSSRARLIRQLLTESLLLSAAAAALAVAIAIGAIAYFKTVDIQLPPGATIELNAPVLFFTAAVALLTTLAAGLMPAWRASRTDLSDALKSGSRGSADRARRRMANGLIVAEVALSLVLLAGAGLLIRSIVNFGSAPLGFDSGHLTAMTVSLPAASYRKPEQRIQFYDRAQLAVSALPGVASTAMTTHVAIRGSGGISAVEVDGAASLPEAVADTEQQSVSEGYFAAMGIRLLQGREFAAQDRDGHQPTAVVNEALARKYFPNLNPLGHRVRPAGGDGPWLTIVGVVADEKQATPFHEMAWASVPIIYHPLAQQTQSSFDLVFRGSASAAAVQKAVQAIDPDVRIGGIETLQKAIARYLAYPQLRAVLMGAFAGLALLLAVVGLYGVLSQLVGQRTQEIGIRMALGAQRKHVVGAVLQEGMALAGLGVIAGMVASEWLTRFLASLLYGVKDHDFPTFAGAALLLMAAALLAAYIPARRAARVEPIISLRAE